MPPDTETIIKFRGPQTSSKHPGSRILDCLVVVECKQALDVSHQRPDCPPNQYSDPDRRDERDQNRPHHNIQQSDPERPDLELVMAAEEERGIREPNVSNDDANQGGDPEDVGGEIEQVYDQHKLFIGYYGRSGRSSLR